MEKQEITLGLIVGNRGIFPSHLCHSGREAMLGVLEEEGIRVVTLGPEDTEYGSVESLSDARKCAELFRAHRQEIAGVLVALPNFGDERGVANALRFSELDVPVLIQAFPDAVGQMSLGNRRDSFCGKMSVCNNLCQYDIPFSLTGQHTVDPESEDFRRDLRRFASVCRVVRGLSHARLGMLGARPTAFNTVRFSEKLLEQSGLTVETLDLSEMVGRVAALGDSDRRVLQKVEAMKAYANLGAVPASSITKMAKLGVAIDEWRIANEYDAIAIQCWTSMEECFGVVPCALMSMMSEALVPSACESDIAGATAMYALSLASQKPSALVDWNNNYGDAEDKAVVFHCSNLPRSVFVEETPLMDYDCLLVDSVGKDNTWGVITGRVRPEPFTYLRVSTDDVAGAITAYMGEGKFTDDPIDTFGGYGVAQVPSFQKLLSHICENGYEHHVAVNLSLVADAIHEAFTKYLGWEVYYHRA